MDIEQQAAKGVKWTAIATLCKAILQLLLLSLAARYYLSAAEFGLYAIVQVVLGFAQLFMDMGLGNAIIHHQQVKQRHIAELFFINLVIALLLASCVFLTAPWIALFFDSQGVEPFLLYIAPSFVIAALFRMHLVMLQKQLAFNVIAKVEIFSHCIGFAVALVCLYLGFNLSALIFGYLANLVFQGMCYWYFSPYQLKCKFPRSYQELKPYCAFGVFQTADATVNYFNSQFDVILVGKLLGAEILGGYALARQFCFRPAMVINPVLTRVAFPLMAKLQHSKELSALYCQLSGVLALINFPLYIALAVFAEPIVYLVFGERWHSIIEIFQLMAIWCLVRSTMNPVGSLLMAVGKVKQLFQWNFSLLFIMPLTIMVSSQYGVLGIVWALLILQCILFVLHRLILLKSLAHIELALFNRRLAVPFVITLVSMGITYLITNAFIFSGLISSGIFSPELETSNVATTAKTTFQLTIFSYANSLYIVGISMVSFVSLYLMSSFYFNPLFKNVIKGKLLTK